MNKELFNILVVDDNHDIHDDFRKIILKSENGIADLKDEADDLLGQLLEDNSHKKQSQTAEQYAITSAFQGLDAINLVKQEKTKPFALAFIDMRMPPGIDGLETLKRIHEIDDNIEIVICTAYQDYDVEHILRETEHINGIMLIKKPFDPLEIQFITRSLCKKWLYKKINKILINSTIEAIFSIDTNGYCNYANIACLNMLGLSDENEILGKQITDFIDNKDSSLNLSLQNEEKDKNNTNTKQTNSGDDVLFKRKNCPPFPAQFHAYPLTHADQKIGSVITFIDISERKESENKVKQAFDGLEIKVNERTQELNDKIKLLNIVDEAQMAFINSSTPNDAFMKIVNGLVDLTESEYGFIGEVCTDKHDKKFIKIHAISGNAWAAIPKETLDQFEIDGLNFYNLDNMFSEIINTGEAVITNSVTIDKTSDDLPQGHPSINSFMGLPVKNGNQLIGIAGVANRKGGYDSSTIQGVSLYLNTTSNLIIAYQNEVSIQQAKMELLKSELMHRSVITNMVDGLITIDKSGKIISYNPAANDIFGYKDDELKDQNISILIPEKHAEQHTGYLDDYFSSGDGGRIIGKVRQLVAIKKDRTLVDIELSVSEIKVDTDTVLTGIVRDITYRRVAEEKLIKAKNTAEKANAAKSDFLSSMSHELRTPMNAILGFGQLLELDDELNENAKEWTKEILHAGHHLLELINEVLDLSKIEAGKLDLVLVDTSLNELLDKCRNLVEPLTIKHSISLTFDLLNKNDKVHADETRLRQVFINILSNAIKYNKTNGSVHVSTSATDDGKMLVCIKDTGIGMSQENLNDLFMPFSRVSDQSDKVEGTGIGLVITKRLIEQMHGSISVISKKDIGSEFIIEIPQAKSFENRNIETSFSSTSKSTSPLENDNRKLILYIEDNPANMKLVVRSLEGLNKYTVMSASTPSEGLELIQKHNPDLVLLDINLPEMNGYQILTELRENLGFLDKPVIAISANAMQNDIDKGLAAGFSDYITKPIDVKHFITTIEKVFAN